MIRRAPKISWMLGLLALPALVLTAGMFSARVQSVLAAPPSQGDATPAPSDPQATPSATRMPNLSIDNQYCLDCHGQPIEPYPLQNGDLLDIYIDPAWHQNSVHGETGIACVQCHTEVGEYPHPAWQAADR
ncbi:MAG: hypothetical protein ACKOC5_01730, partial [Chloroflexota bacterium]